MPITAFPATAKKVGLSFARGCMAKWASDAADDG